MKARKLIERFQSLNETLLRDKDRLVGVDMRGKPVRFQVKGAGSDLFIFNFGQVDSGEPVAQLNKGEFDIKYADNDLSDAKLIRKGSLEIMESCNEADAMTKDRAQYLLKNTVLGGDLKYAFRPKGSSSTSTIHKDGLTPDEYDYVTSVWDKMPGNTSFMDALIRISKGNV